ncbi:MAG: sulfatase-like hydrolase/transferase [Anaerolineae bacterium]|nr:sulfatase-like hydrolase/transferase [Anaerolineae bacterium]
MSETKAPHRRPPNILFFLPDQHRRDWLSCHGSVPLVTPHIDALASRGVRFTRAYCPSPLCAPARASLASGRRYGRTSVRDNSQNYPLALPTYYQSLRDAGYRVGGIGKFDLHKNTQDPENLYWGLNGSRLLAEWGFTDGIDNEGKLDGSSSYRHWGEPRGPYLQFLADRGLAEAYVREHETRGEHFDAYVTALPDDAYCDNWLSDNGLTILETFPRDRPWHLVVNFSGPHNPMDVTARMSRRWETAPMPPAHDNAGDDPDGILRRRRYYAAMIENIDRQVGRLVRAVAERGELENTIILYSSDHGEMLGDHDRWGKGVWYEPSVGIPLIVAGPGVGERVVSDALVSLHDLAATLIDYAGSAPLPGMDALSLRPLLEGRTAEHRSHITGGLQRWQMVLDRRFKLVLGAGESPLLYDPADDPWEDVNRAPDCPVIVRSLAQVIGS